VSRQTLNKGADRKTHWAGTGTHQIHLCNRRNHRICCTLECRYRLGNGSLLDHIVLWCNEKSQRLLIVWEYLAAITICQ